MAKKKDRAFFICPRWTEVVQKPGVTVTGVHQRTITAVEGGLPVARSTLRKALLAIRQTSGVPFDVDAYIVDRRTMSA
jgi:hypothetical protein